jgi:hypothetical protein
LTTLKKYNFYLEILPALALKKTNSFWVNFFNKMAVLTNPSLTK